MGERLICVSTMFSYLEKQNFKIVRTHSCSAPKSRPNLGPVCTLDSVAFYKAKKLFIVIKSCYRVQKVTKILPKRPGGFAESRQVAVYA